MAEVKRGREMTDEDSAKNHLLTGNLMRNKVKMKYEILQKKVPHSIESKATGHHVLQGLQPKISHFSDSG